MQYMVKWNKKREHGFGHTYNVSFGIVIPFFLSGYLDMPAPTLVHAQILSRSSFGIFIRCYNNLVYTDRINATSDRHLLGLMGKRGFITPLLEALPYSPPLPTTPLPLLLQTDPRRE